MAPRPKRSLDDDLARAIAKGDAPACFNLMKRGAKGDACLYIVKFNSDDSGSVAPCRRGEMLALRDSITETSYITSASHAAMSDFFSTMALTKNVSEALVAHVFSTVSLLPTEVLPLAERELRTELKNQYGYESERPDMLGVAFKLLGMGIKLAIDDKREYYARLHVN